MAVAKKKSEKFNRRDGGINNGYKADIYIRARFEQFEGTNRPSVARLSRD